MSLTAYKGEFTLSPIPLEVSMNYCSHKCSYCFANLNSPDRTFDPKSIINKIKNQHSSRSIESFLLRNKYPVLLSNKVDPFSTSNFRQTISVADLLYTNGNGIAWQTRGGNNEGVDKILEFGKKECWYISIPIYDEKKCRELEPGGTSVKQRLDLIDKLIAAGQSVNVGINPTCPDFMSFSEAEELCRILKEKGVIGIWLSFLHLNKKQIANLSPKEYKALDSYGVIDYSTKRSLNNKSYQFSLDMTKIVEEAGLSVFYAGYSKPSAYFDKYYEMYPQNMRNVQGMVNYLYERYPEGAEVNFEDYYNWMYEPFFDEKVSSVDGYVYNVARNLYKRLDFKIKTYRDVLRVFWNNPEVWHSPINLECFVKIKINNKFVLDDEGNFIYCFRKVK